MNTQKQIEKLEMRLELLREKLRLEEIKKQDNKNDWIKIPELGIEVQRDVHEKGKSWDDLKLNDRESSLLTAEQCIWLANSKYADELKMFSGSDDFFIKQPFDRHKKNNYVERFDADSDWANLDWGDPTSRWDWLGVRFVRRLNVNTRKK